MMVFQAHSGRPNGLAYSPDGRTLASAGGDGTLVFWDLTALGAAGPRPRVTIEEAHSTESGSGIPISVSHLEFTPDGAALVSSGDDGTVRVWATADGRLMRTFRQLPDEFTDLGVHAVSPDGKYVAWAGGSLGVVPSVVIKRLDRLRSKAVCGVGHRNAIGNMAAAEPYLASASADRTVRLWRWETGEQVGEFRHRGFVRGLAVTADGTRIAASSGVTITVRDVDPDTGKCGRPRTLLGHTRTVNCLALTPRSNRLLSTADDGTLRVWDLGTARPLQAFTPGLGPLHWVAAAPDATTLAFSTDRGMVGLIDADG